MWKYGFSILLCLSAAVYAGPPEGYPFSDFDSGIQTAKTEDKPIFLYFGRQGCGWCEKTNAEAFTNSDVKTLYSEHYVLIYIDSEGSARLTLPSGERITEMELGSRLKALATPVFAFLSATGEPLLRVPGVQTAEDFLEYDRFIHGEHYKTQSLSDFRRGDS